MINKDIDTGEILTTLGKLTLLEVGTIEPNKSVLLYVLKQNRTKYYLIVNVYKNNTASVVVTDKNYAVVQHIDLSNTTYQEIIKTAKELIKRHQLETLAMDKNHASLPTVFYVYRDLYLEREQLQEDFDITIRVNDAVETHNRGNVLMGIEGYRIQTKNGVKMSEKQLLEYDLKAYFGANYNHAYVRERYKQLEKLEITPMTIDNDIVKKITEILGLQGKTQEQIIVIRDTVRLYTDKHKQRYRKEQNHTMFDKYAKLYSATSAVVEDYLRSK